MANWHEWRNPAIPPVDGDWDFSISNGVLSMLKLVNGEWIQVASFAAAGAFTGSEDSDTLDGFHKSDLDGLYASADHIHDGTVDTWHLVGGSGEPAFGSGWSSYSGEPVRFKKIGGVVYIMGTAVATTGASSIMFTLPAGYRPAGKMHFWSASYSFFVNTDGTVTAASLGAGYVLNFIFPIA